MPKSGVAVARAREAVAVFCAMPNGIGGKGSHTHCDKLSVILRLGADEVFCDGGSRCYTRSAELRNLYRSTKAHNTLAIDEVDQNIISPGPSGSLSMRQRRSSFSYRSFPVAPSFPERRPPW